MPRQTAHLHLVCVFENLSMPASSIWHVAGTIRGRWGRAQCHPLLRGGKQLVSVATTTQRTHLARATDTKVSKAWTVCLCSCKTNGSFERSHSCAKEPFCANTSTSEIIKVLNTTKDLPSGSRFGHRAFSLWNSLLLPENPDPLPLTSQTRGGHCVPTSFCLRVHHSKGTSPQQSTKKIKILALVTAAKLQMIHFACSCAQLDKTTQ